VRCECESVMPTFGHYRQVLHDVSLHMSGRSGGQSQHCLGLDECELLLDAQERRAEVEAPLR
jgi:hypothetical protein